MERLKALLSSKRGRDCSLQEVLDFALESAFEKHDPIRKAKRVEKRNQKKAKSPAQSPAATSDSKAASPPSVCPGTRSKEKRKSLPANTIHEVQTRDQGQCSFTNPEGKRCAQRRWLQIHHKTPISKGGNNKPENLTTLCAAHHRLIHAAMEKKSLALQCADGIYPILT